jgi:hypothetical protein
MPRSLQPIHHHPTRLASCLTSLPSRTPTLVSPKSSLVPSSVDLKPRSTLQGLKLFYMAFNKSSSLVQSLNISTSGCKNSMLAQSLVVVRSSEELSPVGGNLVSLYFYTNTTSLKNVLPECSSFDNFTFQCVFLDFNSNQWSDAGCTHSYANGTHVCQCNHLTPFTLTVVSHLS